MHNIAKACLLSALIVLPATAAMAQPKGEGTGLGESSTGMAMQVARAQMMTQRGQQLAYTNQFDLGALPEYAPKEVLTGNLVLMGSNYITDGMLGGYWEDAFKQFHPEVTFVWDMKTSRATMPAVALGLADIGIGRGADFGNVQLFQRYFDQDPLEVEIATGSYDYPGWNPGFGVVVHKDNPLERISMEQLDGIFGSARSGGWHGTDWHPEWARGPEQNIRSWGELGLDGAWADKTVNVYGLNQRYNQSVTISDMILAGSDKWNEDLRIYANYVTADGKLARSLNADLAEDPHGIAIIAAPTTTLGGNDGELALKVLPLARTNAGPFIPYTIETLQDRTYPMADNIFAYADAHSENPLVREFLKFVVSRDGQALVMKDAKYLPLNGEASNAQLAVLERN